MALTDSEKKESIPFYPDHMRTEAKVMIGLLILVIIIGLIGMWLPVSLDAPADALNTPAHVKPEWYFLGLYQVLKFIPKTAGVMLPIAAIALLAFWPFIDRKPDRSRKVYRIRAAVVAALVIIGILLTIWGEVS